MITKVLKRANQERMMLHGFDACFVYHSGPYIILVNTKENNQQISNTQNNTTYRARKYKHLVRLEINL